MFSGTEIALIEIGLFLIISHFIKKKTTPLKELYWVIYYWAMFTILTGLWELSFITHYKYVNKLSQSLISTHTHVWTTPYDISYILPWKLASIFYAEYGAYADREYMVRNDDWSRAIEGTHALFCALFCFFAIVSYLFDKKNRYMVCLSVAMGGQLMNSILYLVNYFIQCRNPDSVNYGSPMFPTGVLLSKRLFMYINIFWFILPSYAIYILISRPHSGISDSKC